MNNLNPLTETSFPALTTLMLNARLLACHKYFYDDYDDHPEISKHELNQLLDGDVYLELSNGKTIVFSAHTEVFSVKFGLVNVIRDGAIELSQTPFWENKIGSLILGLELLFSEYRDNPFGLRIKLENHGFSLVYASNTAFTSDALVIK